MAFDIGKWWQDEQQNKLEAIANQETYQPSDIREAAQAPQYQVGYDEQQQPAQPINYATPVNWDYYWSSQPQEQAPQQQEEVVQQPVNMIPYFTEESMVQPASEQPTYQQDTRNAIASTLLPQTPLVDYSTISPFINAGSPMLGGLAFTLSGLGGPEQAFASQNEENQPTLESSDNQRTIIDTGKQTPIEQALGVNEFKQLLGQAANNSDESENNNKNQSDDKESQNKNQLIPVEWYEPISSTPSVNAANALINGIADINDYLDIPISQEYAALPDNQLLSSQGLGIQSPRDMGEASNVVLDPRYTMPSGEQLQQLTPAEQAAWEARTAEGLGFAAAAPAAAAAAVAGGAGLIPAAATAIGLTSLARNANEKEEQAVEENKQAQEQAKKTAEAAEKAGAEASSEPLIFGQYTRDILNQLYEDEIYDAAMNYQPYRQKLEEAAREAGYDLYNSFAEYGDLGDTLDYESRRNITRDIFGLNPNRRDLAIDGLQDIYWENETLNDQMTDEEKLDAILNRHWGAQYIVNPYRWFADQSYQMAHPFAGNSAVDKYMQHWINTGVIPAGDNAYNGVKGKAGLLDTNDLIAQIAVGNALYQMQRGWIPTARDLAAMDAILQKAGDTASFKFLDEANDEGYQGRKWNPGNRNYSAQETIGDIERAVKTNSELAFEPYTDFGLALGDANLSDAWANAVQNKTGREVGRKDR